MNMFNLVPEFRTLTYNSKHKPEIEKHEFTPLESAEHLEKIAINLELEKYHNWRAIIKDVTGGLLALYRQVGIEVDPNTVPDILLIDEKYQTRNVVSNYDVSYNKTIVFLDPDKIRLVDVRQIHHERHHSIAKTAILDKRAYTRHGTEHLYQYENGLGYKRLVSPNTVLERGVMLEEGVVTFCAHDYAKRSTNPLIAQIRSNDLGIDSPNIDPRYLGAKNIVGKILEDAYNSFGVQYRQDIFHEILHTRFEPKNKFVLISMIDKIYGRGIGRKLFLCQFNFSDIDTLLKLLLTKKQ